MAFCLKTAGLNDTIDWASEALDSYNWAISNTKAGDEGVKPAIGFPLKDIRAFAAASLYRLTGDVQYQNQLKTDASAVTTSTILRDEARWAPYLYATIPDSITSDEDLSTRFNGALIATADLFASTSAIRACRFGGDYYMPMLIGQSTTPLVFEVIMGYHLCKNSNPAKASDYLSCLYTTSDYFLGCNPLNPPGLPVSVCVIPGGCFIWIRGTTANAIWRPESLLTVHGAMKAGQQAWEPGT